jgi:hypothetical protein
LFCHVTVVPFETVSVLGLNAIFIMLTVLDWAGGWFWDEEDVPDGLLESLLQPKSPTEAAKTARKTGATIFFFMGPPRDWGLRT